MLIQPRADLYARILSRLDREEKLMKLKRRLILRSLGFLLSFLLFIPLAARLYADMAGSGLAQFFSLLFTDFNIIMANLGDYAFTLLESAPIVSLSLALAAVLAVLFYVAKLEDAYSDFKKLTVN